MGWFQRRDTIRSLRRKLAAKTNELALLGDRYQVLHRQHSDAVKRAANTERANEQLAVRLARASGRLDLCNAERLRAQAKQAAAENAAEDLGNRIRRAAVTLADPGVEVAQANADALRVLEGGQSDG